MKYGICLIVGGIVGWVASKFVPPQPERRAGLPAAVGFISAFLAGCFFTSWFGNGASYHNNFSPITYHIEYGTRRHTPSARPS